MIELKTFYVTFGLGTFMHNHYQEIHAHNEDIVRAYMNKRYQNLWSMVYLEPPKNCVPLSKPFELLYEFAEHV